MHAPLWKQRKDEEEPKKKSERTNFLKLVKVRKIRAAENELTPPKRLKARKTGWGGKSMGNEVAGLINEKASEINDDSE